MRTFSAFTVAILCLLLASTTSAQTAHGQSSFTANTSTYVVNVQQNGTGSGLTSNITSHTSGISAVYGHANFNGYGVYGVIDSQDNNGIGVFGRSGGSCCGIPGVFEQDATNGGGFSTILVGQYLNSSNQIVPAFTVDPTGVFGGRFYATPDPFNDDLYIGRNVGNTGNVFRVDRTGAVFADGGFHTGGADFAESFSVKGLKAEYSEGDVLTIDDSSNRQLTRTSQPYSTLVAGIFSTKPGVLASPHASGEVPASEVPLAVVGVVPCKVTAENGAIRRGDLLVTSSRQGYAMKGTDRGKMVGAVLGKALEPLPNGTGVIQVLVTLQ